eukprot:Skav225754  [mRNA]  locus=scaffold28:146303:146930:+ [translate_table: standard]
MSPFHTYRQSFFQSQLSHSEFLAQCAHLSDAPSHLDTQAESASSDVSDFCVFQSLLLKTLQTFPIPTRAGTPER